MINDRLASFYIWLICHNICLCRFGLGRACGWIDARVFDGHTKGHRCPWCWIRTTGRGFPRYDRLWALWRRRWYCPMCSPPPGSRASRLIIAHNAISKEIRELHADVLRWAAEIREARSEED